MAAQNDNKTLVYGAVLIAGLAYFGVIDPILKAIGIKDDAEDKANDTALAASERAKGWNPNYFKTVKGLILTKQSAINLSKILREATSGWGTNEEKIYGVLRAIKNQAALSFLCSVYFELYKVDLYQTLVDELSQSEKVVVANIVNALPAK